MLERRGFLRGLAALPLIGGGVTLIGQPTAAAVPVTDTLFERYYAWVVHEHAELMAEREQRLDPAEPALASTYATLRRHWARDLYQCPRDPVVARIATAAPPSSRAAVVLSSVGVPLTAGGRDA